VQSGPQDHWGVYSYPLYLRLKAAAPEFEDVAAFQAGGSRFSVRREGSSEAARPLSAEYVTGNYFSVLGIKAYGGRFFTPDNDRPSAPALRGTESPRLAVDLRCRPLRRRCEPDCGWPSVYGDRCGRALGFSARRCEVIHRTPGDR